RLPRAAACRSRGRARRRGLRARPSGHRRASRAPHLRVAHNPAMQAPSGGGPFAARVTAAAAMLLADIARASAPTWSEAGGVAAQAESLPARTSPLADLSAEAYAAALSAEGGDFEVGRAYAKAVEPPLRIAEAAADVVELAAYVAENADPARRADAVSAGLV